MRSSLRDAEVAGSHRVTTELPGIVPIYEYECRDCGRQFEKLVRSGEAVACPACNGGHLEQLLSLFAVNSESTRQRSLTQARRKNTKVQRDKEMSEWEDYQNHHH